jgi:hypothetical protein
MAINKVQNMLMIHNGKCPVCSNATSIENEGSYWVSDGKVKLKITCDCGLEFYATCGVKEIECEMEDEISSTLD